MILYPKKKMDQMDMSHSWGIISLRHKVIWYAKGTGTVPPLFSTFLHAFRRRRRLVTLVFLEFEMNMCHVLGFLCCTSDNHSDWDNAWPLPSSEEKTYLCKSLWVERYPSKIYGPSHNSNITIWSQCTFFQKCSNSALQQSIQDSLLAT